MSKLEADTCGKFAGLTAAFKSLKTLDCKLIWQPKTRHHAWEISSNLDVFFNLLMMEMMEIKFTMKREIKTKLKSK